MTEIRATPDPRSTYRHNLLLLAGLLCIALATACDDSPDDRPYIVFEGGGFVFNYRVADAYYGFVARAERDIPEGTLLEAVFEDPAGGPPFTMTQPARPDRLKYSFRSPPLRGIEAGRDYRVELLLRDPASGAVLATYTRTFRSQISQDVQPESPLTVGPGYHRNPQQGRREDLPAPSSDR